MKKLIVLVGMLGSFALYAEQVERMPMQDYLPTEFDEMFEIKTDAYNKVVLDCWGFVKGVYFYRQDKISTQVYMEETECLEFNQFLADAKNQHQAVCLELDADAKFLEVTNKTPEECK